MAEPDVEIPVSDLYTSFLNSGYDGRMNSTLFGKYLGKLAEKVRKTHDMVVVGFNWSGGPED